MSEERQRCRAAGSNSCSGKGRRKKQQLHLSASSSWREGDVYLTFILTSHAFFLFVCFILLFFVCFSFFFLFSFPLHFPVDFPANLYFCFPSLLRISAPANVPDIGKEHGIKAILPVQFPLYKEFWCLLLCCFHFLPVSWVSCSHYTLHIILQATS